MSKFGSFVGLENESLFFDKVDAVLGKGKVYTINALREYGRFMKIVSSSTMKAAPSKVVDTVWHENIMFTKDYAKYCDDVNGSYIHHTPSLKGDNSLFLSTIKDYESLFGERPPANVWFYSTTSEWLRYQYHKILNDLRIKKKKKTSGGSCSSCSSCSDCSSFPSD